MISSLSELKNKEVISIRDSSRLGFIDDVEIDTDDASVRSFIICGRYRFFGLLGKDDDVIIKCNEIEVVGEDTILVKTEIRSKVTKKNTVTLESLLK